MSVSVIEVGTSTAVKDKEGKTLFVEKNYDEWVENPREFCEHFTKFYTWLRRHSSPDHVGVSFGDWLDENGFKDGGSPSSVIASMAKKGYVALAVYKYEHSGVSYSATVVGNNPYSDPWDSGFAGFIYASREDIRKEYGVKRLSKTVLENFYDLCKAEVEEYSYWANGECYCYTLLDEDGGVIDSISGYYGDSEENDSSALENLGVVLFEE